MGYKVESREWHKIIFILSDALLFPPLEREKVPSQRGGEV